MANFRFEALSYPGDCRLTVAGEPFPLMGLARFSEDMSVEASDLIASSLPLWPLLALAFEVFASTGIQKASSLPDHPPNLSLPSRV